VLGKAVFFGETAFFAGQAAVGGTSAASLPGSCFHDVRTGLFGDDYLRKVSRPDASPQRAHQGGFGDPTGLFFADNVPLPSEVWLLKKSSTLKRPSLRTDQLTTIEAIDWTPDALEASLKQPG
jgi:glutamyl-tRNA synthetase